jgi:hypothetical protein
MHVIFFFWVDFGNGVTENLGFGNCHECHHRQLAYVIFQLEPQSSLKLPLRYLPTRYLPTLHHLDPSMHTPTTVSSPFWIVK